MKIIRSIALLLLLFAVSSQLLYSTEPDAEFLSINKEYRLNSDGSVDFTYRHILKLNSYFAVNRRYGETFIVYNPKFQTLNVLNSETTMRDGMRVSSPENAFNEVLPGFAADAPSFNHLREMVITHVGLERECRVELEYQIHTESGFLPGLMGEEIFADHVPVRFMEVKLIIPKGQKLSYMIFNSEIEPAINNKTQETEYIWKMERIQGIPAEKYQPELGEFCPRLVFSTVQSWDEIKEFLNEFVKEGVALSVLSSKAVDEMLRSDCVGDDRLQTLQKHVCDEIGNVICTPWVYGFRSRSANAIYSENTGTAWEKSILLASFLRHIGLSASPVLISRYNQFAHEIPSLLQFDNFAVRVRDEHGQQLYLSPVHRQDRDYRSQIEGKTLLNTKKGTKVLSKIKQTSRKANYCRMKAELRLDESYCYSGSGTFSYGGYFNRQFSFSTSNDNIRGEIAKVLSNSIMKKLNIKGLSNEAAEFYVDLISSDTLKFSEGYSRWRLPDFSRSFKDLDIEVSSVERSSPIKLPVAFSVYYELTLKTPSSLSIMNPSTEEKIENSVGTVKISISKIDDSLRINRFLQFKKCEIDSSEYQNLRNLVVLWDDPRFSEIVFKEIHSE